MHTTRRAGFTIAELLVAAAITSLIVVLLGTMFSSLSSTASHATERIDAYRDARAAMHMIERDFSNLVIAKPLASPSPSPSPSPLASYFASDYDESNQSQSQARHLCGLISIKNTPTPSATPGDMCTVVYYCGWNNNAYHLYRFFRDSVATLKIFQGKIRNGVLAYLGTPDLYSQVGTNDEVLADNCWNLIVTAYDSSGNIISPISYTGGTTSNKYICDPDAKTTCDRDPTTGNPKMPAMIEVSFKAMSSSAARTAIRSGVGASVWMAQDESGASQQDKNTYQRLIAPHVYTFRTRIQLK